MKLIRTEDAVGHVLCHDMTQIIKDQYKDARFRKGHIVTEADIPVLLSMGKEHLYVWEMTPGMVHENDAAERLLALCKLSHPVFCQVYLGCPDTSLDHLRSATASGIESLPQMRGFLPAVFRPASHDELISLLITARKDRTVARMVFYHVIDDAAHCLTITGIRKKDHILCIRIQTFCLLRQNLLLCLPEGIRQILVFCL